MNTSKPEQLREEAEPIRLALISELQKILSGTVPENEAQEKWRLGILEGLANPANFKIVVHRLPGVEQSPTLKMGISGNEPEDDKKGMIIHLPQEQTESLFKHVTPADYRTLCEFGLSEACAYYQKKLDESDPLHLSGDYNGVYTYGELYAMELNNAKRNVKFFEALDPNADLREIIKPF